MSFLASVREVFANTSTQVITVVAGAAVAAAGAVFLPVGNVVGNLVWPEEIEIAQRVTTQEGEKTPLSIVLRDKSAAAGLTGGTVTVTPQIDAILLEGQTTFTFPASDGSVSVPPDGGLWVRARTFGTYRIDVSVTTNRGAIFNGYVDVVSLEKAPTTGEDDLTGVWNISLSGHHGTMKLQESLQNPRFTGTAEFEGDIIYQVRGWRDGTAFHASLSNDKLRVTRVADGIYCLRSSGSVRWMVVNAKVDTKAARDNDAHPDAADYSGEKCPGFPENLVDLKGAGSFMATVRLE